MRVLAALILTAFMGTASWAAEDEGASEAMTAILDAMGFKQTNDLNAGNCKITIDVDQDTAMKSVPILQKYGIFNDDLSKNDLLRKPISTSIVIGLQFAPIQIKAFYDKTASADKCLFIHRLISDDEYGNSRKEMMFSYTFDKTLYKKINWDKFSSRNLDKVAKYFRFGSDLGIRMQSE